MAGQAALPLMEVVRPIVLEREVAGAVLMLPRPFRLNLAILTALWLVWVVQLGRLPTPEVTQLLRLQRLLQKVDWLDQA